MDEFNVDHLHEAVISWYGDHRRDLPWRTAGDPWAVVMSEFMLQQTPVARVLPVFTQWWERWPTPAALASATSAEVLRAWGRLGYPRRAQRLHEVARRLVAEHGGRVPSDLETLRSLPGIGEYTAGAIHSFAFAGRAIVLDTNVRRVFARAVTGDERPAASLTRTERELALQLVPEHDAHVWAAATMELGALVCTARSPRCEACPIQDQCAWFAAGKPTFDGPVRRSQAWHGTDRQCRGRLLAAARESHGPIAKTVLDATWDDDEQRERCLDALLDEGLLSLNESGMFLLGSGEG